MQGFNQRAASAVAVAFLLAACSPPAPSAPPPPAVTAAPAIGRTVNEWDEFTGRIEAVGYVEVRPRVSGFIEKVAFTEGKEVRQGEVLFVIDQREYKDALDRAQAELTRAQTQAKLAHSVADHAEALIAENAVSREEYDARVSGTAEADAAIQGAEAAVRTAKLNLDWTLVRAPISGRISRAEVTAGNVVQGGAPTPTLLTTIVSLDPVYVYFEGDEQAYLRYNQLARDGTRQSSRNVKNPVRMGLANETGFPHTGYVDFVDNQLNPNTGTIRARAVFSNKDRFFTPGLFARIQLLGSGKFDAVMVQDGAIGTDQDRKFVYVLKPDSTVEYRGVELGRIVDGLRVIQKGVAVGDEVVINGLQRIRPGMKVNATVTTMEPSDSGQTAQRGS
jgi:membrane fusion protein, multidrug efflux system